MLKQKNSIKNLKKVANEFLATDLAIEEFEIVDAYAVGKTIMQLIDIAEQAFKIRLKSPDLMAAFDKLK